MTRDPAQASAAGARRSPTRDFLTGVARAFGGAIFFALPLLMTMEMWWLGFYMDPLRLALFLLVTLPMLIGLDYYSGFRETSSWWEDTIDGLVAYAVGFVAAAAILFLLAVIDPSMPLREIVGKISLHAVPASFGAVLANSQFGGSAGEGGSAAARERKERAGYGAELFFMAAGATFFAFNLAPTEEIPLLAHMMTPARALAVLAVSVLLQHAFVYAVDFRGSHAMPAETPGWSLFLRFTVPGYAIALLVSAYVLWTFGRFDGGAMSSYVIQAVVLGFPASLGAAAARLIL